MRLRVLFVSFAMLGAVLLLAPAALFAQSSSDALAQRRQQLQAQLDQVEAQITQTQNTLTSLGGQHQSLQNDINILDAKIKKSKLQLKATQIQIQALGQNITLHAKTINTLTVKIGTERDAVANIIRQTREIDDYSLVELALSSQDVSGFFSDLDSFTSLKGALGDSTARLTDTRASTENEKSQLEDQKTQQTKLENVQTAEKAQIETQEAQKKDLLTQTKTKEASYQSVLAVQQKTAAQIRTELFSLAGGGGQIPLPTAIALAKQAGAATGVRPALILGILKQETNLGANVGQCLLTNSPNKGDGKGKNTGTPFDGVMKPTRDVDPFIAITTELGIDPLTQPISCPQAGGYGGAMGPGQFIASTWLLLEGRVAKQAGHPGSPANPWNNLDAFTATAILMADNGATTGTPAAEKLAALRYFAGWGGASNPANSFYGDSVMGFADQFQSDINTLGGQ